MYRDNLFAKKHFYDTFKLKEFADDNSESDENGGNSPKGGNHFGKRRKCSVSAIYPFPSMFSKDLYRRHVKTRVCLGTGQLTSTANDKLALDKSSLGNSSTNSR